MTQQELITGAETPILRKKCAPVEDFGAALQQLIEDLYDTMLNPKEDGEPTGIGIAAPQIGVDARVCLVTLNVGSKKEDRVLVLINPEIIQKSDHLCVMEEGCLSLPKVFGKVRRPSKIQLRWQNVDGVFIEKKFDGWDARIIQHEVDHLNGILFIDYKSE